MPIDHNIYQNQPQLDIMGGIERGMRMSDMAKDRETDRAAKKQAMAMDATKQQTEMARQLAWSINDQASYTNARNTALKSGLPGADGMPEQYDPGLVKQLQMSTLTASEQMAQQKDVVDNQYRDKQLASNAADRQASREQAYAVAGVARGDRLQARQDGLNEKQAVRNEKNRAGLSEVQGRKETINANLDILDKMITDSGTWEATGSHNQDMDRLVDQIATDTAKLMDPASVARPGEVELVKRGLIQPGVFTNTNATARAILKNFRNEIGSRAKTAYEVRGLADPDGPHVAQRADNTQNVVERFMSPMVPEAQAAGGGSFESLLKAAPNMNESDMGALKWAAQNKTDPRAQKILSNLSSKHGGR